MAFDSELNSLKAGSTIAGYEILRVVGSGGFGITYEARSPVTGRHVAIKEFFPLGIASRESATRIVFATRDAEVVEWALRRFETSTTEQSKLSHPNIVEVIHYVKDNDTGYMIMEYVEGQTLEQWLRQRETPPTLEELRPIIAPIFDALRYLHAQKLIHRDIAPDNIMVRKDGRPVIIDFGAIKLIEQRTQMQSRTNRSFTISKPFYSPPEQLQGDVEQIDARIDVYAIGATIYRALAGRPPASAEDRTQQIAFERGDPLVPIGKMMPSLPAGQAAAIDNAVAFRAKERTPSIDALRTALGWGDFTQIDAAAALPPTAVVPPAEPREDVAARPTPPEAPRKSLGKGWVMPVVGTAAALGAVLLLFAGIFPLNLFGTRGPAVIVHQPPPVLSREPQRVEPKVTPAPPVQVAPKVETPAPSTPRAEPQRVEREVPPKQETIVPSAPQQQAAPEPPAPKPDPQVAARRDFELAYKVNTREAYEQFLARHPDGFYASLARAEREKLVRQETAELTRNLNAELQRAGCRPAGTEDEWDEASRRGLLAYNRHAATKFDANAPSAEALSALRASTARVCPLVCAAGQQPQGDVCVTVACGRGMIRAANGRCVRPRAEPRAPVARQDRQQQPRQKLKCRWGDFNKGEQPHRQVCN